MEIFSYVNELYKAKTGQDIDGPALEEFASIIVAAQGIEAAGKMCIRDSPKDVLMEMEAIAIK